MIKQEIKAVFDIINSVPAIKWVDEDYGQIDAYEGERPPVAFPCALVTFNTSGDPLGGDEYDYTDTVTIRVAHNRLGDRSAKAPVAAVNLTLAKLDDVEAVKAAMLAAGYYFTSFITERRVDGIAAHAIAFTITH